MAVLFIIIIIFVAIVIMLFYRAENYLKQLKVAQKELVNAQKNYQLLNTSLVTTAAKHEELLKLRLKKIEQQVNDSNLTVSPSIDIISPLVCHYGQIVFEVSSGKSKLKPMVQNCFDIHQKGLYKEFLSFINLQDNSIRKQWNYDNTAGYVTLVEQLLASLQEQITAK